MQGGRGEEEGNIEKKKVAITAVKRRLTLEVMGQWGSPRVCLYHKHSAPPYHTQPPFFFLHSSEHPTRRRLFNYPPCTHIPPTPNPCLKRGNKEAEKDWLPQLELGVRMDRQINRMLERMEEHQEGSGE